ncbi:multicopper oxidase domain-containing protein [Chitinophaga arvensicola]|uniref:Copper-resistance protein, CopA family n=1 Tax=Chitinophaga arvensicola TaxID=29529 RepID=A0A1I0RMW0_9BACT|nr:multicopper oxidase domain-containing protein [Chitinophaga arvensicola]SEW42608.1 copper-resistance protein, CopA family [Chitinophaga arvensicola]
MKAVLLYITFMSLCSIAAAQASSPKVVRYDLYVGDTMVNYSGKMRHALAINGTIPGPTLHFTEGDTAEIYVHNTLKEETSIHWHGLILPNQYDGVSYLTTRPIKGGQTHLFRFPIVQHGTYWYHSHTMFQEQSGMYGAIVFHERKPTIGKEYTLLLSDWTDMHPHTVNRYLHNANDWFAIKKGSVQSYGEAIKHQHFKTKVTNEWKRLNAMDVSDVYYERFLSNGKEVDTQPQFRAGDKVRLRIINGSASTYFWLNYAGGKLTVVANDGADVEPVEVDRLLVGVSETYDVIVTIPEDMQYEFLATAEDRTRSTSLWLGQGMKMPAKPLPRLKYFEGMKMMNGMIKMNGDLDTSSGMQMSNQVMDMNTVMYPEITGGEETPAKPMDHSMHGMQMDSASGDIVTLNYGMLKAPEKTTLPAGPVKLLQFELTGNMNRYVWSINNKTVSESDKILIKKGETVRIVLFNNTMMRHPMHLHGHFFRLLNGQGEYSPLKTVLDIMPMEVDTIEFAATEPGGDWFFHCHILYHMMSGMGRVFSYENSPPNPEVPDPAMGYKMVQMDDRKLHPMARVGLESTGSDGEITVANTRYRLSTEWRVGLNDRHGYESESHFGRYLGKMQWLFPYIGWDVRYRKMDEPEKNLFGQKNTKDFRQVFHVGLEYTLPMLIVADASVDTDGKVRVQLMRDDVPVTRRLRFSFMVNTDKEYMAGFRYIVTKNFAFSTHYDSDMGLGAGITLSY